jgi:hypothetical protein
MVVLRILALAGEATSGARVPSKSKATSTFVAANSSRIRA